MTLKKKLQYNLLMVLYNKKIMIIINRWLYNNNLSGPIPDSIGNLNNLKEL